VYQPKKPGQEPRHVDYESSQRQNNVSMWFRGWLLLPNLPRRRRMHSNKKE
jgi:hypothetical protein